MIKIQLGRSGLFAEIDNADFDLISGCKWYVFKDQNCIYAKNRNNVRMHRLLMAAKENEEIDHKDGNGLNNKRNNLRRATRSQNMANKRVFKKTGSKYLGVFKDMNGKGWIAASRKDGKLTRKCVPTEREAAIEYNKMALKNHGEFANINIIPNT